MPGKDSLLFVVLRRVRVELTATASAVGGAGFSRTPAASRHAPKRSVRSSRRLTAVHFLLLVSCYASSRAGFKRSSTRATSAETLGRHALAPTPRESAGATTRRCTESNTSNTHDAGLRTARLAT